MVDYVQCSNTQLISICIVQRPEATYKYLNSLLTSLPVSVYFSCRLLGGAYVRFFGKVVPAPRHERARRSDHLLRGGRWRVEHPSALRLGGVCLHRRHRPVHRGRAVPADEPGTQHDAASEDIPGLEGAVTGHEGGGRRHLEAAAVARARVCSPYCGQARAGKHILHLMVFFTCC